MEPLALSVNVHVGHVPEVARSIGPIPLLAAGLLADAVSVVPEPAPKWLVELVDQIQVTQSENAPSGFQIAFHAARDPMAVSADYDLLHSGYVRPGNRVVLSVVLNGHAGVLFDGFITHQELRPGNGRGPDQLIVTGEDVSVAMSLVELSKEYPLRGDAAVAFEVLDRWRVLGVVPVVVPTPSSFVSLEKVPQQLSTDRDHLLQLASQHGNVFCILPGPRVGLNLAYWGPPPRFLPPQKTLTANVGPETNAQIESFAYDHLRTELSYGTTLPPRGEVEIPVATLASTLLPPFATSPALKFLSLFQRRTLVNHPGLTLVQTMTRAQNVTDVSTCQVVTARGSLDGLRYGDVLSAPGVVGVRGVGHSYDGFYYVQQVTHTLGRGQYKQDFMLTREGLGTTAQHLGSLADAWSSLPSQLRSLYL